MTGRTSRWSWASIATAFLFIEFRGAGPELAWMSNLRQSFRPKPKLYVVQKAASRRVVEPDDVYSFNRSDPGEDFQVRDRQPNGCGRRQLDRARARLLKKSSSKLHGCHPWRGKSEFRRLESAPRIEAGTEPCAEL